MVAGKCLQRLCSGIRQTAMGRSRIPVVLKKVKKGQNKFLATLALQGQKRRLQESP